MSSPVCAEKHRELPPIFDSKRTFAGIGRFNNGKRNNDPYPDISKTKPAIEEGAWPADLAKPTQEIHLSEIKDEIAPKLNKIGDAWYWYFKSVFDLQIYPIIQKNSDQTRKSTQLQKKIAEKTSFIEIFNAYFEALSIDFANLNWKKYLLRKRTAHLKPIIENLLWLAEGIEDEVSPVNGSILNSSIGQLIEFTEYASKRNFSLPDPMVEAAGIEWVKITWRFEKFSAIAVFESEERNSWFFTVFDWNLVEKYENSFSIRGLLEAIEFFSRH